MLDNDVRTWVSRVVTSWRQGSTPSAVAVLDAHPELRAQESVVMDLALAEYRLRRAAGEEVETTQFCAQFSTYRDELRKMLSVERGLPALREPAWPLPGDMFLEFELLKLLGTGAASHVFLARQTSIGDRLVALKITPYGTSEAHTLGKLPHNHIVPVMSVHYDQETELSAVCMPYLGAATLQDLVNQAWADGPSRDARRGYRPPADAVRAAAAKGAEDLALEGNKAGSAPERPQVAGSYWTTIARLGGQLASGLAFTHSRRVLHHDLKPSNVLLTPDGSPMLLDFNLAWDPHHTTARLGGTLPYMAPEQFHLTFVANSAAGPSADPRSDVYSLGALLFQLCTGRLPHGLPPTEMQASVQFFARAHLAGAPPVRSLNPAVPRPLARVIDQCLQTALAQRPQSAAALSEALQGIAGQEQSRRVWKHAALVLATASLAGATYLTAGPNFRPVSTTPAAVDAPMSAFERHLQKARQFLQVDDFLAAEHELSSALQLQDEPAVRRSLVYCLYKQNSMPMAMFHAKLLAEKFPGDAEIANNLGRCAMQQGQVEVAKRYLNRAIELDSSQYIPLHNRALLNVRAPTGERDADVGISFIERAIELAPDRPMLHQSAAVLYDLALQLDGASPEWKARLQFHVERAAELGCPREMLSSQPFARHYAQERWLQAALETASSGGVLPLSDPEVFYVPTDTELADLTGRFGQGLASR